MTEGIHDDQKRDSEKGPEGSPPHTVKSANSDSFAAIGRIKPPPVCVIPSLRVESASIKELSTRCFTPAEAHSRAGIKRTSDREAFAGVLPPVDVPPPPSSSTVVSSSSSTTSTTSTASQYEETHISAAPGNREAPRSETSRTGRLNQRWFTDPNTNHVYRLTTGTVPIMSDGSILFVSSRAKPQWILPKGGWESDESMEQSALRETFEEAGVLGEVGPVLSEVEYEAGKAKKRRLDKEALQQKRKLDAKASNSPEDEHQAKDTKSVCSVHKEKDSFPSDIEVMTTPSATPIDDSISIVSNASDTSSSCYTHVRMSLFPLYVSEVMEKWPESGRARRLFDIDSAIRMLEHRPEFRSALEEVKQKGLHLKGRCGSEDGNNPN